ncbi:MAG: SDR family oxidoreductase [Desulfobacteraceae bacterium]|nr:SDR family oxidoreductase [Desulfobacteraceae bacterium]
MMPKHSSVVLVSGASSGIGRATVEYLASHGFHVFAGARDRRALEELSRIPNTTALRLDVTRPEEIRAARKMIEDKGMGLFGLVNNAGIVEVGPLMDLESASLRAQFEVNFFGIHELTKTFFPLLLQSQGRVVMISSDSGFFATPFAGPYCASKFALEGYSDSLRREITHHGVKVILIEPGPVATAIWGKAEKSIDPDKFPHSIFIKEAKALGEYSIAQGQRDALPPSAVAEAIYWALTSAKPRLRYLVAKKSWEYRLIKILPAYFVDRLVRKKIQQTIRIAKKMAAE